jgi:Fe-S cluster biogenesis protein NfuA
MRRFFVVRKGEFRYYRRDMRDEIEAVLNQVRPALRMDGGGIELVEFNEETGVVQVRLQGACVGCPMSQVTLKMGVEMALKDAIPSITEVIAVE